MTPRELAARAATIRLSPSNLTDRFAGFALTGVAFESGHVLAMRRFPASSLGTGYSSVWHRAPGGAWTFYSDVAPERSCARYFGASVTQNIVAPIDVTWRDARTFVVCVGDRLTWVVALRASIATRVLSRLAPVVPASAWTSPAASAMIGGVAGMALGTGALTLAGRTPNGQRFAAQPHQLWLVAASSARLGGQDLGSTCRLTDRVLLGDFRIPARGLFVLVDARMSAP